MAGISGRSGGQNRKRPEAKLGNPNHAKSVMPGFDRVDASSEPLPIIPTPGDWDVAALQFWAAVLESPTRIFAESVDYAYLWIVCAAIDQCAKSGYRAGQLQALQTMMSDLGVTEIQRRQARILIDRTPPPAALASVTQLEDANKLFGA